MGLRAALLTALLLGPLAAHAEKWNSSFFGNKAIEGYDPVAYFTAGKAVKGDKDFQLEHNGVNWHFASAENRELFRTEPGRYSPQFGGYCAYAVAAKEELVGIDPKAWSIVAGKLYLNYSPKVRELWNANQAEFIAKGHAVWPRIGRD